MRNAHAFLLLLVPAMAIVPGAVQAQKVQRCIGADGRAIYTDRRCDDIGAAQRLPPAAVPGTRAVRGGCPRQLSQLVGEIGGAIRAGDVNRLSAIYDWRGVSGASATRLFDQLEAIVERPLVDIAPVYRDSGPAPTATAVPAAAEPATAGTPGVVDTGPQAWMPSWRQPPAAGTDPTSGADGPAVDPATTTTTPARPYPVALRVEQTFARNSTPTRTVFGLRRAYGCFWISL